MLFCFSRGLLEVLIDRWLPASFFVGSALVLLYAIAAFIGFRASWEDLYRPRVNRLTLDKESTFNLVTPNKARILTTE